MISSCAVLNFKLDNENYSVVMDTVNDLTINESVDITTHPLVNGDEVADHIIRKCATLSLDGLFSMGNKQGIIINNNRVSLADVETMFTRVMKEGIICSLYKIMYNGLNSNIMFTQKENLVIDSLSFTKKINSLSASINFKQIMFSQVIDYDEATDDEFAPRIEPLTERSFSDVLLNNDKVIQAFMEFLMNNDMLSVDFVKALSTNASEYVLAGIITGTIMGIIVAVAVGAGAVSAGIGTLVVVFLALEAVVITGIVKLIRSAVKRSKFRFKNFKNPTESEIRRFNNLLQGLYDELEIINKKIKVYRLPTDDDFTATLGINDDYFIFDFTTNTTENTKTIKKINGVETQINEKSKVVTVTNQNGDILGTWNLKSCIDNYNDAHPENAIYKDEVNNVYAHIIYAPVSEEEYNKYYDNKEEVYKMETNKSKLTNYLIVVSTFNPEKFTEYMCECIKEYCYK